MAKGAEAEKLKNESSHLQVAVAGIVAGIVSRFVIAPLDVVKIRLQLQSRSHSTSTLHGTVQTFTTLVKNEGVRALWKGNIPASFLYPLYGGVQFATYRGLTTYLHTLPTPPSEPTVNFFAGGLAGAMATTATYPLDLLRTRLAAAYYNPSAVSPTQSRHPSNALTQALRALHAEHKTEPFRPYFRGLPAALASIFPYMGLFFLGYESLKRTIASLDTSPHPWLRLLGAPDAVAGTIASVASKTAVFPLDTVRKRLQVQGQRGGEIGRYPLHEGGMVRTIREIVLKEGLSGLYRGLGIGLVKAAPAGAVTIWAFERCLVVMRKIEELEEEMREKR